MYMYVFTEEKTIMNSEMNYTFTFQIMYVSDYRIG